MSALPVAMKSRIISSSLIVLLAAASPLSLVWLLYVMDLVMLPFGVAHTVAFLGWCLFYMLMVVFPLWLHDASSRADEVSRLPLPFTRVGAAVAFFVPVRHTLMPYSVMRSLLFRATGKLSTATLVKTWSASWLVMLSGAGAYVLSKLAIVSLGFKLLTLSIYGPAAVFCFLSLLLVLRFERGMSSGEY